MAEPDEATARSGPILLTWVLLSMLLHAILWTSGARPTALVGAINRGAERVEQRATGEESDDVVRKAIQLQQDTRPFWTVLVALGDVVANPLMLIVRSTVVATLFSGLAALRARPLGFAIGLRWCAFAQGFWVLGLAVRVGLVVGLGRSEAETSATLLLSPGSYAAPIWSGLEQVDFFHILGWIALARGGVRRGQVGWFAATMICVTLWLLEAIMIISATLVVGAGMRSSLIPDYTP